MSLSKVCRPRGAPDKEPIHTLRQISVQGYERRARLTRDLPPTVHERTGRLRLCKVACEAGSSTHPTKTSSLHYDDPLRNAICGVGDTSAKASSRSHNSTASGARSEQVLRKRRRLHKARYQARSSCTRPRGPQAKAEAPSLRLFLFIQRSSSMRRQGIPSDVPI